MHRWIRHSLSAYVGLLVTGAVASSGVVLPSDNALTPTYDRPESATPAETYYLVPAAEPESISVGTES